MNSLTALCLVILLSACAPLMDTLTGTRQPTGAIPADQQLFTEGLDQFTRQQGPETLQQLKNSFPDSPWAVRAESILALSKQVHQQTLQLKELQRQLDEQTSDQQIRLMEDRLNQCTAEKKRLQKELDISTKRLEALRELTIELELKQP